MLIEMFWRDKDKRKLLSYVRKFNASLTRMSKQNPELADAGILPQRLSATEIQNREMTRKDFNNLIKSIDRWFKKPDKRGLQSRDIITKAGIKMTRWEYMETVYAANRLNAQKRERKQKSTRSIRQQYSRENIEQTVAQKFAEIQKKLTTKNPYADYTAEEARGSWEAFRKRVMNQASSAYQEKMNALYYYNYNKAIYENFPDDQARQMSWLLEDFGLTGEQLYEITGAYPELDIEYMYSPEESQSRFEYWMNMFPVVAQRLVDGNDLVQ